MKTALLLLALYGVGDDDPRVRQPSERYLATRGYAVVLLNRLTPYLLDDFRMRAALRKLEKRYYAVWEAKLDRNDWQEYPSLVLLHPRCAPVVLVFRVRTFFKWDWDGGWAVSSIDQPSFGRFLAFYKARVRARVAWGSYASGNHFGQCGYGEYNAATLEFLRDLRYRGAPVWAGKALLTFLRWRNATLERRYHFRDPNFVHRDR